VLLTSRQGHPALVAKCDLLLGTNCWTGLGRQNSRMMETQTGRVSGRAPLSSSWIVVNPFSLSFSVFLACVMACLGFHGAPLTSADRVMDRCRRLASWIVCAARVAAKHWAHAAREAVVTQPVIGGIWAINKHGQETGAGLMARVGQSCEPTSTRDFASVVAFPQRLACRCSSLQRNTVDGPNGRGCWTV